MVLFLDVEELMQTETMDIIGMVRIRQNKIFENIFSTVPEGGASFDKCFDTYHGPEGFSEPETAAIRDFIMKQ